MDATVFIKYFIWLILFNKSTGTIKYHIKKQNIIII